jgi:uncharacterized membrane protein YphA (DoxX/SURF4 family)
MMQNAMYLTILLARAILAAVLVAAAGAKLADTPGFATTLVGLGIPARREALVRGLAVAIPLIEVGFGLALVSGLWPEATSVAVLILMGFFSAVVIMALFRRPYVTCRCFGALSDSQFSARGLARDAVLTALAAAVVWSEAVRHPRFDGPVASIVLLICGYLVFAAAAAQAASTIAVLRKRRQS